MQTDQTPPIIGIYLITELLNFLSVGGGKNNTFFYIIDNRTDQLLDQVDVLQATADRHLRFHQLHQAGQ